jgi:cell division protein FtsZ
VDQDANIIVGATFDETLEGVIRVSVVATGIDHAGLQRSVTEPEARIAELTQKLRAEELRTDQQQRSAAERIETRPLATPTLATAAPVTSEAIEAAAKAAVAAAVLPMIEDVTIRPIPPKPSLFPEQMALPSDPPPTPRAFIPPAPERTVNRPRRMPGIDELPRPAQAELRAKRGEGEFDNPEKRKVSLLRRLAAVGLGRRDDLEEAEKSPVRPVRPPPAPRPMDRPSERPAAAPPPRPAMAAPPLPRSPEPVSEYAKRPSPHGPDTLARQGPIYPPMEEDQLDIPAFLRRQAN